MPVDDAFSRPDLPDDPDELRSLLVEASGRYSLDDLVAVVGGLDALVDLHDRPLEKDLADERPIAGRAGRLAGLVSTVLADRPAWEEQFALPPRLDDEIVLAIQRFLRRPDVRSAVEQHRSSDERLAAAVVWIVGRANGLFGQRRRRPGRTAADLWYWFGVSDASGIGRKLASTLDMLDAESHRSMEYPWTPIQVGEPGTLTASIRRLVIQQRDAVVTLWLREVEHAASARPIRPIGGGKVRVTLRPVSIEAASKVSIDGRQMVALFVDGEPGDPDEVLALSIPDAHLLAQRLQGALTGPAAPTEPDPPTLRSV